MHSKPQKRTAERLSCRRSWKSCSTAKTKAPARMPLPFRQPSCGLRSRFETVLKGSEKVKLHARNQRQGRRHHRCELRKHSRAGSGIGGTPNAFASENPKQFRISKSKLRKANFRVEKLPFRSLFLLNFEFVSNFEIRH